MGFFPQHLLISSLNQAISVNNSAGLDLGLGGPGVVTAAMVAGPWLKGHPPGWVHAVRREGSGRGDRQQRSHVQRERLGDSGGAGLPCALFHGAG